MKADFLFDYKEPFVCTAIHKGHEIAPDIEANLGISHETRLMEEDPFTDYFAEICNNRIIVKTSRFEVDLNRNRDMAFYKTPDDAWGLPVRKEETSPAVIQRTLAKYDAFYEEVTNHFDIMKKKHNKFFVYDIHSYNHHRLGPKQPFDDAENNPEIILGTNIMTGQCLDLVDQLQREMRDFDFFGRQIDVRQNVKYPGGYFSKWINTRYKGNVCCVAIEFKKIFMDEWSSTLYPEIQKKLRDLLFSTFDSIRSFMGSCCTF